MPPLQRQDETLALSQDDDDDNTNDCYYDSDEDNKNTVKAIVNIRSNEISDIVLPVSTTTTMSKPSSQNPSSSLSSSPRSSSLRSILSSSSSRSSSSSSSMSSSSSSSSNSSSSSTRSVQFSDYSVMYLIPQKEEYTVEENHTMYYNELDYNRFRDEVMITLHHMNQGQYLDTPNYTFRGLESKMNVYVLERKRTVQAAVRAILTQQQQQQRSSHNKILDDEWIQQFYTTRFTAQDTVTSHRMGLYDAHVAAELV